MSLRIFDPGWAEFSLEKKVYGDTPERQATREGVAACVAAFRPLLSYAAGMRAGGARPLPREEVPSCITVESATGGRA